MSNCLPVQRRDWRVELLKEFNVAVTGVGGQGNILLSHLMASAARMEGFEVQTGETLGMAQRGGPVMSFVRYGKKVYSPIIPDHEADILVSLEPIEAIRAFHFVGQGTWVLLSTKKKPPLSVLLGEQEYPELEEIEASLESVGARTFAMNATELAEKAGNSKSANVCLYGGIAALGISHIRLEYFKSALKIIPSEQLQANLRAFDLGYENMLSAKSRRGRNTETSV
jgi:indolepyruvate ferredoxin oxidoreductase beta subunit